MKFKNKKYFKAVLGLGIGVVLLTTAVFANYDSANGYTVCKNAFKKIAYAENYSVDATIKAKVDNSDIINNYASYKLNTGGNPSLSSESTAEEVGYSTYCSKYTVQDGLHINQYSYSEPGESYGYITEAYKEGEPFVNSIGGNAETGTKIINFIEAVGDTMIGDIKNSFVLTSDEGGISTYNVNLSTEQMPSYITAGVSMMSSVIKDDMQCYDGDTSSTMSFLFASGEPYLKDVGATMSVDDDGNPVQVKGNANFVGYDADGNEHVLSIELNFDFYDIGTTEIERVPDETIATLEDYSEPVNYNAESTLPAVADETE